MLSIDLKSALDKIHELEQRVPGFLDALTAALDNADQSAVVQQLLQRFAPSVAVLEHQAIDDLKKIIASARGVDADLLPFLDALLSLGSQLAQFLPQLVELISVLRLRQPA